MFCWLALKVTSFQQREIFPDSANSQAAKLSKKKTHKTSFLSHRLMKTLPRMCHVSKGLHPISIFRQNSNRVWSKISIFWHTQITGRIVIFDYITCFSLENTHVFTYHWVAFQRLISMCTSSFLCPVLTRKVRYVSRCLFHERRGFRTIYVSLSLNWITENVGMLIFTIVLMEHESSISSV